jgi:hypothetical protein
MPLFFLPYLYSQLVLTSFVTVLSGPSVPLPGDYE